MKLVVNDLLVGYDRIGTANKTAVLLHGWGANRQSLASLAATLSVSYTVYSLDVPGFGESAKPETVWGLTEYSHWLADCVDKLGISKPDLLLGHSNGGAIAIKAVSSGLEVGKLILIGASGIRGRERGRKLFLKSIAKTGKVAVMALPKSLKNKVRGKWYGAIGSELYAVKGMEQFFKKVVSEDLLVESAMISSPTLLIYGSEDKATPPAYGEIYSRSIENSRLEIIEGAGHYAFIDRPGAVRAVIEEFVK